MYSCIRAIIFGEDFSSDPVSRGLGLLVHLFSGGQVQIDTAIVAQVHDCIHLHKCVYLQVLCFDWTASIKQNMLGNTSVSVCCHLLAYTVR